MTRFSKLVVMLGATAGLVLAGGAGCDGGGTATGGSAGSTTSAGGGGGEAGSGGTTTTGGAGGTGGTATGGGGAGGGAAAPGSPGMALVSAGTHAKSTNYTMVFTLGQSSPIQGRTTSTSYTMQGGLIGATGSLK